MQHGLLAVLVGMGLFSVGCGSDSGTSGGSGAQGGSGNGGSAGAGNTTGSGGSAGNGGSGGATGPTPKAQFLPQPTGTCPDFKNGAVTFSPAGIPPRSVTLYMSDAASSLHGPLLLYWHGTGSQPAEAQYSLLSAMNDIKAAGGIVAAPSHDPTSTPFPWFYTAGGAKDDDVKVADEIVACAIQKVGIDLRHIHSLGMSAGGLMTTQLSYRRSGYLASVVTYSGGQIGAPPNQDPSNKFAAMIFHGGTSDVVYGVSFQAASETYLKSLKTAGHFGFICNHGNGHSVPTGDAGSVWQFFQDHPFGTDPSPYVGGLPSGFPSYCAL